MKYKVKEQDDITIFKLEDEKLDTNNSGLLKAEFNILIRGNDKKKLIIDISDVKTCDSSGLSSLLVANRLLNANGGNLIVVTKNEKILQLLQITQLQRVITICNTVAEAIEQLQN